MKTKDSGIRQLIGLRIKRVRTLRGLSQEELSEKVGLSSKYLSSIERGKENPTLDAFIKLSQALNFDIYELFNYAGEKSVQDSRKFLIDLIKSSDKEKLDLAAKLIRTIVL